MQQPQGSSALVGRGPPGASWWLGMTGDLTRMPISATSSVQNDTSGAVDSCTGSGTVPGRAAPRASWGPGMGPTHSRVAMAATTGAQEGP